MTRINLLLAWLVLAVLAGLLLFKANLNSDSLFLDSLMVDLFQHGGHWRDWKITPAPAYLPDMAAYALGYFIFPNAAQRIAFVCVVQALLLAWAGMRLAARIHPSLSTNARTLIVAVVAFAALAADNSGMWLFFNSTNNHFAALLFPLLCTAFVLDFWQTRRRVTAALIVACVALGTASTPVFILSFTLPALLAAVLAWFRLRAYPAFRTFAVKTAGLILAGQILASVLNAFLISFNAFSGRAPMTPKAALNSLGAFAAATRTTFGTDNPYTFAFAVAGTLVAAWAVVACLRHLRAFRRASGGMAGQVPAWSGTAWRYHLVLLFLLIALPLNIVGAVASGGFVDPFAYRYFAFPIALAWLLWIVRLDTGGFLAQRAVTYVLPLLVLLEAGAGILAAQRLLAGSGRDSVAALARSGILPGNDALGRCIDQEARRGFVFDAGVADFWNARGTLYATAAPTYILPVTNDLKPLFHMMTIGPLMDPNRYGIRSYNFAILRKPGTSNPFDMTRDTTGKLLPPPTRVVACENADSELWLYEGRALDAPVRKQVARFLLQTGRPATYVDTGGGLSGETGRAQAEARNAVEGSDGVGYLTRGPYVKLRARPYKITIAYAATQGGNKWDAGRFNDGAKPVALASGEFPVGEGKVEFHVEPKRTVDDTEIRTWFGGRGTLTVRSITIETADAAAPTPGGGR